MRAFTRRTFFGTALATMRLPRMVGLALAFFVLSAAPAFARCDPAAEPERADIANARDAVLAAHRSEAPAREDRRLEVTSEFRFPTG